MNKKIYTKPSVPDNTQQAGQSQFNSGIACLERIDDLLKKLNKVTNLRYSGWKGDDVSKLRHTQNFTLLLSLFKELQAKMEEKQCTDYFEQLQDIRRDLKVGNHKFKDLDLMEIKLRRFAQTKGMLLPDRATASGVAEA